MLAHHAAMQEERRNDLTMSLLSLCRLVLLLSSWPVNGSARGFASPPVGMKSIYVAALVLAADAACYGASAKPCRIKHRRRGVEPQSTWKIAAS